MILYGGELSLLPNSYLDYEGFEFGSAIPIVDPMLGGRLTVHTPLDGFSIDLSSYSGKIRFEDKNEFSPVTSFEDRYLFMGMSMEYLSDSWWIRAEYLMQRESPKVKLDSAYVEAAYKFTEYWQSAICYEFADIDLGTPEAQYIQDTQVERRELTLGLNYWLNPNLVFKCSYHLVDGNRFAIPETVEDYFVALLQGFQEQTHLVVVGVQFSF